MTKKYMLTQSFIYESIFLNEIYKNVKFREVSELNSQLSLKFTLQRG